MFTSSPFFISRNHTEVFSNYYRPRWKTLVKLVWEILVWSLWKKSRLFYTHNNFRKNYSFNASRIEKIHWNIVKITFSCGNYRILTFCFVLFFFLFVSFFVCVCAAYLIRGPRTTITDPGPSSTVAFFRITSKILEFGTCSFTIVERIIKAIFMGYFSTLRFDSGKIFMIINLSRGHTLVYLKLIAKCNHWKQPFLIRRKLGRQNSMKNGRI